MHVQSWSCYQVLTPLVILIDNILWSGSPPSAVHEGDHHFPACCSPGTNGEKVWCYIKLNSDYRKREGVDGMNIMGCEGKWTGYHLKPPHPQNVFSRQWFYSTNILIYLYGFIFDWNGNCKCHFSYWAQNFFSFLFFLNLGLLYCPCIITIWPSVVHCRLSVLDPVPLCCSISRYILLHEHNGSFSRSFLWVSGSKSIQQVFQYLILLLLKTIFIFHYAEWKVVGREDGSSDVRLLSQINATYSVSVCTKGGGSAPCQSTETYILQAVCTHICNRSCAFHKLFSSSCTWLLLMTWEYFPRLHFPCT